MDAKAFGEELAAIVTQQVEKKAAPLQARISALEAEVRRGHERIKALEAQAE